jgi:hypothetical protein
MHDSPPPPLFKFLCALTVLQTRQSGNQQRTLGPGTALKELLGEYFPTRISQGAAALAPSVMAELINNLYIFFVWKSCFRIWHPL